MSVSTVLTQSALPLASTRQATESDQATPGEKPDDAGKAAESIASTTRWTAGSAWFSNESDRKGTLVPGRFADIAVFSADYFSIPEERIKDLETVLTIVGGRIVHASNEFSSMAPLPLPVSPSWSPVDGCDL